jgi:hypothetical protein
MTSFGLIPPELSIAMAVIVGLPVLDRVLR